jgi:hypothetical protein
MKVKSHDDLSPFTRTPTSCIRERPKVFQFTVFCSWWQYVIHDYPTKPSTSHHHQSGNREVGKPRRPHGPLFCPAYTTHGTPHSNEMDCLPGRYHSREYKPSPSHFDKQTRCFSHQLGPKQGNLAWSPKSTYAACWTLFMG